MSEEYKFKKENLTSIIEGDPLIVGKHYLVLHNFPHKAVDDVVLGAKPGKHTYFGQGEDGRHIFVKWEKLPPWRFYRGREAMRGVPSIYGLKVVELSGRFLIDGETCKVNAKTFSIGYANYNSPNREYREMYDKARGLAERPPENNFMTA